MQAGLATMLGFHPSRNAMIETNPIRARIADLRARLTSLRGYL